MSKERTKLCESCPFHSSNIKDKSKLKKLIPHCTLCYCPTLSKTSCLSCECALVHAEQYGINPEEYPPLWRAVLPLEDEVMIDTLLLNEEQNEEEAE